jgi:hypothetical protein
MIRIGSTWSDTSSHCSKALDRGVRRLLPQTSNYAQSTRTLGASVIIRMVMTKILTICLIFNLSCSVINGAVPRRKQATASSIRCKTRKHKANLKAISKRKELAKLPTYTACGCGCCGGLKPRVKCLYRSKGDDLQTIIEADKKAASNTKLCALVGCSLPVKYKYCD